MVRKFYRHSEQVSPNGNISPQGIINQLGRPNLDSLAVLIREAVQNSWDARVSDKVTVRFGIEGWVLDNKQRKILKDIVFYDCPPPNSHLSLKRLLDSKSPISVLALYDRGTTGLGGPTRADEFTAKNESKDFIDFLRNVGQPPDKKFSGGTYGYGKAAFYRSSQARTICVHTKCEYKNTVESRFIASALGAPFAFEKTKFTGRHWWGEKDKDIAEPIKGQQADVIATELGMPHFESESLGTTILLIQPNLNETENKQDIKGWEKILNKAAEYLTIYFWPKMLTYNKKPSMEFKVSWMGKNIEVPNPLEFPAIKPFAESMYRLKNKEHLDESVFQHALLEIKSNKPIQKLGTLSLQSFPTIQSNLNFEEGENNSQNFTHHVALMRNPELVVKYYEGPSTGTDAIGYAGVFITDKDVDEIFANSEPPTHDDWAFKSLEERSHRVFVRVALRNIYNEMDEFAKPFNYQPSKGEFLPIGAFATNLANALIPAVSATSANTSVRSNGKNGQSNDTGKIDEIKTKKSESINTPPVYKPSEKSSDKSQIIGKSRVKVVNDGAFVLLDSVPSLRVEFNITHAQNAAGSLVKIFAQAIIDGQQQETDPPMGGSEAEVLRWKDPKGKIYAGSSEIFIAENLAGDWEVTLSLPDDIVLGVDIKAEARP
jgi:hypothetical protein